MMSEIFEQANPSFLKISKWETAKASLVAGFTTKMGGFSQPPFDTFNLGLHVPDSYEAIIQNRKKLAEKLDFPLNRWVAAEQTHGVNIHVLTHHDKGKGAYHYESSIQDVDGLITNQAGILCTAFFADCVPLFFFDPVTGYIGIAHAGWKGTTKNIAGKMVEKLVDLNVDPSNLLIVIGPSISMENYEVDQHVVDHIDHKFKEKVTVMTKTDPEHYYLDLKQLNQEILQDYGVLQKNIEVSQLCTYREKNLFFSHRRDQGKTGRMLGYIGYLL